MEISAQLARGIERRGHLHAFEPLRRPRRQKRDLHALREPHLFLEPLLVGAYLLVEPSVLDRDRGLTGKQRQDLDVALRERVELGALQIDDADAAVLDQEGNRQLGAHVGNQLDVARVLRHVGDEHRLAMERRVADQPFAQTHARDRHLLAVLHGKLHLELVIGVQEQDAEGAIVDHATGELRDPREQLVEIEHRRDIAADFRERLERLGVETAPLE